MISVIVVDDSLTDRTLISGMLTKSLDASIRTAENGQVAMEMIRMERPDLVLTDMQMPVMNGLQLLEAIQDDFPMVPVVLMTAQGSEELAADALHAGATSYVPKRRLARDLVRTIVRIVRAVREDVVASSLMHHLKDSQLHFVLSNNLPSIMDLVVHVQAMLRCIALRDETERLRVGLALESALLNAFYHGNLEIHELDSGPGTPDFAELLKTRFAQEPWRNRHIDVRINLSRHEAKFVITDEGPGFNHAAFDSSEALTGDPRNSGRGLTLIHAVMDEVAFNPAGNSITMVKKAFVADNSTATSAGS
ncbi:MAG: response regulator [Planctomycetaceae bacterium]|nr:response regulator [Planctomycetaceae bacterium]